jgi:hypothetical protein
VLLERLWKRSSLVKAPPYGARLQPLDMSPKSLLLARTPRLSRLVVGRDVAALFSPLRGETAPHFISETSTRRGAIAASQTPKGAEAVDSAQASICSLQVQGSAPGARFTPTCSRLCLWPCRCHQYVRRPVFARRCFRRLCHRLRPRRHRRLSLSLDDADCFWHGTRIHDMALLGLLRTVLTLPCLHNLPECTPY